MGINTYCIEFIDMKLTFHSKINDYMSMSVDM